MTFFLVIDQVLRIFPLFSLIFRIFTLLDIVHNPFLAKKHLFSILLFFHFGRKFFFSHPTNTTSQNIGRGANAWALPPTSNFGGIVPPVPPRFPPLEKMLF